MKKEQIYEVRAGWLDNETIGHLIVGSDKRQDVLAFEYEEEWIQNHADCFLDPNLLPYTGRQYAENGMFSFLEDASPDRWGKMLLKRREQKDAEIEGRAPRELNDIDFLLGIDDEIRMGGIRIYEKDGYLSQSAFSVPPISSLRALQDTSIKFEKAGAILKATELNDFVTTGSSLGGARPKVNVLDEKGELWIAKFESDRDRNTAEAWEYVANQLGEKCGLHMAEGRLEHVGGRCAYLTKRFDRLPNKRIHFASAMTMLNKHDGQDASFLELAECISMISADAKADLQELWKRIAFSIAINNTDCHLRNHGFLLTKEGWRLSPAYDMNPNPFEGYLALSIDGTNKKPDFKILTETAAFYGITEPKEIIHSIRQTVSDNYVKLAQKANISRNEITQMGRFMAKEEALL